MVKQETFNFQNKVQVLDGPVVTMDYVPYTITVEGKKYNLQNRKFCLECSPFKKHNTKADDPSREAKKKAPYCEWPQETKEKCRITLAKRGLERKQKLIEMAGGGCIHCGYNKNDRALSFHHRNAKGKKFALSMNCLWSKSMEEILEEFKKCDLVCLNCHAEIEGEIAKTKPGYYRTLLDKT